MAERSSITQVMQWGAEATATPGTAVPAGKLMTSLMLEMGAKVNMDRFRPSGYKYATIVVPGKDFVEGRLTGSPTYTELVYPLSSLLGAATIATPSGGTNSRSWTFAPSSTANDAARTFTVELGSSVRAQQFAYGLVTGLTMTFDRDKISLGGSMLGYAMTDGFTMTSTATAISLVPILAKQMTVYSDATSGSLGSSTLTRVLSGELSITNKYGPLWVVNAANASFVTHIDIEPQARLRLTVEADSGGQAHLANARAGTTEFVRLQAVGDVIEAGTITYKNTVDLAGKIIEISDFKDDQGVYAVDYTFDIVHDSGWGKALTWETINSLTGL